MRTNNELTAIAGAYYKGLAGTSCEGRLIYVVNRTEIHGDVDVRVVTLRGRRGVGNERWMREESLLHNYRKVEMMTRREAADRLGIGTFEIEMRVTRGRLPGALHDGEMMVEQEALEAHRTDPAPAVEPEPIVSEAPAPKGAADMPTRAELQEWVARVEEVNEKLERLLTLAEETEQKRLTYYEQTYQPQVNGNGVEGGLWQ